MSEVQTVRIHDKEYIPVVERIKLLHKDHEELKDGKSELQIRTEILYDDVDKVTVKAIVVCKRGYFNGHATSVKTRQTIEGQSPLEVAETSAIGRALGNAGYGLTDSFASSDEVKAKIGLICEIDDCKEPLTEAMVTFSQKTFGKNLCFKHQNDARKEKQGGKDSEESPFKEPMDEDIPEFRD